ncbi:MAG: AbrB/MazE/SpoVT family DNA-binding domain-containing protein [Treponema sp.]|nr:AbrB/MazE/SpoVT family DNA-binding domain-containing protein [Treponema sp.]
MVLDVIQITGGKGVCFPSSIIDAFGINDKIVMETRQNEIVITPVERKVPRKNWNEAFQKMNQNGDDKLIFSDNSSDLEWEWQ